MKSYTVAEKFEWPRVEGRLRAFQHLVYKNIAKDLVDKRKIVQILPRPQGNYLLHEYERYLTIQIAKKALPDLTLDNPPTVLSPSGRSAEEEQDEDDDVEARKLFDAIGEREGTYFMFFKGEKMEVLNSYTKMGGLSKKAFIVPNQGFWVTSLVHLKQKPGAPLGKDALKRAVAPYKNTPKSLDGMAYQPLKRHLEIADKWGLGSEARASSGAVEQLPPLAAGADTNQFGAGCRPQRSQRPIRRRRQPN